MKREMTTWGRLIGGCLMKNMRVILCMGCLLSLLIGCSSQMEEAKPTGQKTGITKGKTESQTGVYKNQEPHNTVEKKEDEIVTVTLVEKDFLPSNEEDLAYVDKINAALRNHGIKARLELVSLPKGEYSEKLRLLVDSGQVPDIMWLRDGIDKEFVKKGLLLDYTAYINESDVFEEVMEPYHRARITAYPYLLRIRYHTPKIAMVRKDLLDALGVSEIETVEDYYRLLKAIATSDFDENGMADTYGITDTGGTDRLDSIFNAAFGMPTTWIQQEDGQYIYHLVSNGEKEKLAFYRKLREENILDPDYMTTRWDTMEEKFYSGKVGMVIGSAGKVLDIYQNKLRMAGIETTLVPLDPPLGKESRGVAPVDVRGENRGFAISAHSEHVDEAFQILEFMASEEGQYLDRLGFEGRDYEKDSSGRVTRTEAGDSWYARFFDVPSWESPVSLLSATGEQSLEIARNYYLEDKNINIPDHLKEKWQAMNLLYREYTYKIIMGEYELSAFDEFVTRWYSIGGKEITRLANQQLQP